MFLKIDPAAELPIYEQVVRQIKFAVAGRIVKPGELVPSVREVARGLAINPNTVAKAYRQLQVEGILEPVRGAGLQVAGGAVGRCTQERLDLLRHRLRQVLREARQSHLDGQAVRQLVQTELNGLGLPVERTATGPHPNPLPEGEGTHGDSPRPPSGRRAGGEGNHLDSPRPPGGREAGGEGTLPQSRNQTPDHSEGETPA